jgi:hypothetical protein
VSHGSGEDDDIGDFNAVFKDNVIDEESGDESDNDETEGFTRPDFEMQIIKSN